MLTQAEALRRYPALSRCARLRQHPQSGAYVLLSPERGLKLNDSAALVLRRCNGRKTTDEIVSELVELSSRGEQERARVATDVTELLQQLVARGLLVLKAEP
jgi:pyrroloquinoline quinone biosynthesis protein D